MNNQMMTALLIIGVIIAVALCIFVMVLIYGIRAIQDKNNNNNNNNNSNSGNNNNPNLEAELRRLEIERSQMNEIILQLTKRNDGYNDYNRYPPRDYPREQQPASTDYSSVVSVSPMEDKNQVIITKNEMHSFSELLEDLSMVNKNYYRQLISFSQALEGIIIKRSYYYERISYKKTKPVAKINIKKKKIIVTTNIGKLKVGNDQSTSYALKPIRVTIKDGESLKTAKNNIYDSYLRQSGKLKLEVVKDVTDEKVQEG